MTQARKVAQLSQAELGSAVRLDRTAITKAEAGERKLDSLELARIAAVLKRSIEWFLTPPLASVISRRTRRETDDESKADALLEGLARDVNLLIEMGFLIPPAAPQPLTVDSFETAERAARDLRTRLRIPPGPIWDVIKIAENLGCYAFSLDLNDESLDGAYLRLDSGGVALINGAALSGRRRFTLLHELGHHLFADDFSDEWIVGVDGDERERLINAFVIHFLVPREACMTRWSELSGADDPRTAAITIAAEFGASWSAVIGHLTNLRLVDSETRERLTFDRPTRADYLEGGVVIREELQPPALPPLFSRAVMKGYRRNKIGRSRAVELLRGAVSERDLPEPDQVPVESMRDQFDLD